MHDPAVVDLETVLASRGHFFIGGEWQEPSTANLIEVENPATEQIFATVPDATADDVDRAVRAAHDAFASWSETDVATRRDLLNRFAREIAARREALACLVSTEMGTPLELSRIVQADLPVSVIQGYVSAMHVLEHVEVIGNSRVSREPAGVVAAITPWNYPIHQAVSKVGAALATGCTVVLKPSQVTPLSAYLLADAAAAAGIPSGVLNIITGSGRIAGEAMSAHPLVDVVSFTGSTGAGRAVMQTAASTIKRVALELGGKSANVVLPDADLEAAVRRGTEHVLENSGQTCTAWSRLVVPRDRQDEVVDIVRSVIGGVVVGDPFDPRTTMGPVATGDQRLTIQGFVERARRDGAQLAAGGGPTSTDVGHFVQPAAFASVDTGMELAQEEVFGPVLAILPYDDEADALRIANDTKFGLSGAVWSRDHDRAAAFAAKLRTGQVSLNGGSFNPAAPFGGYKQSGIGRELGGHGFDDFLETKSVQH